jgi:D-alanyl-lipoteichoic acid acyltransferase DltB (MBOAT superfamily)
MLFSSFEFIFFFLPVVLVLYFFLQKVTYKKTALIFLVVASLFFYGWWKWDYLYLIIFSILLNYLMSLFLRTRSRYRKSAMLVGVTLNLGVLGYFKYLYFILHNFASLFDLQVSIDKISLPLAISFFTFQQISYLVDTYQGKVEKPTFLGYILFVTFFPQLIAGPIVHHSEMMPQFHKKSLGWFDCRMLEKGCLLFLIGLFKKVVIADQLSIFVDKGYAGSAILSSVEAWVCSLSYTMQLYFDFSGYSDMALGIAYLFNIKLPVNFNSPYKAINIQDFWRRWHITLSRFLRDYIYIPLGGNRKGKIGSSLNVFVTFFLGGVWHGAGWNFVVWGLLHATVSALHRIFAPYFKFREPFSWLVTFLFINITWVFFRSEDLDFSIDMLRRMFFIEKVEWDFVINLFRENLKQIVTLLGLIIFCKYSLNSNEILDKFRRDWFYQLLMILASLSSFYFLFFDGNSTKFLYFDF